MLGETARTKKVGSFEVLVEERVGRGPRGEVFRARNAKGQIVACKIIRRARVGCPE
jgi:serine/threonine protein kinase